MKKYLLPLCLTFIGLITSNSNSLAQGDWKNIITDNYSFTDLVFQENGIWVATDGNGLERYCNLGDLDFRMTTNDGLPSNVVTAITQDDEEIWIGTNLGIAHFIDEQWIIYSVLNSELLYNQVIDIQAQKNGKIWIGFEDAIQSFDPENNIWKSYEYSNIGTFINFEMDGSGEVWAAFPQDVVQFSTPNQIYHLPPNYFTYIDNQNNVSYDTIHSTIEFISVDGDGKIRVINGYDTWIDFENKIIDFGWGRDIFGIIHNESITDYWWARPMELYNAIKTDPTNIFVNPEITHYVNPNMLISAKLKKAPLRFSPSGDLWVLHEKGISILWLSGDPATCEKLILPNNLPQPDFKFSIAPNPSIGNITISNEMVTSTNRMWVEIYSTDGKFVDEKIIAEQISTIDLSNLKHGFYFVRIFSENGWSRVEKISIF